jgi:hypothetical protein
MAASVAFYSFCLNGSCRFLNSRAIKDYRQAIKTAPRWARRILGKGECALLIGLGFLFLKMIRYGLFEALASLVCVLNKFNTHSAVDHPILWDIGI